MEILSVMLGTAIGALSRTYLSIRINHCLKQHLFPWSTFMINMLSCILIGYLTSILIKNSLWTSFLISGLLGGLSTYSTFANEAVHLLRNNRTKKLAITYMCASLLGGLALIYLGLKL